MGINEKSYNFISSAGHIDSHVPTIGDSIVMNEKFELFAVLFTIWLATCAVLKQMSLSIGSSVEIHREVKMSGMSWWIHIEISRIDRHRDEIDNRFSRVVSKAKQFIYCVSVQQRFSSDNSTKITTKHAWIHLQGKVCQIAKVITNNTSSHICKINITTCLATTFMTMVPVLSAFVSAKNGKQLNSLK